MPVKILQTKKRKKTAIAVGIILSLLVIGGIAALLVYFLVIRKQPPAPPPTVTTYNCDDVNGCTEVSGPSGTYKTKDDCTANCKQPPGPTPPSSCPKIPEALSNVKANWTKDNKAANDFVNKLFPDGSPITMNGATKPCDTNACIQYKNNKGDIKSITACPFGQYMTFENGQFSCATPPPSGDCKSVKRSVCMDDVPTLALAGGNTVTMTKGGKTYSLPKVEIALYWGGLVGKAKAPKPGGDWINWSGNITAQYLKNVVQFVQEKHISILFVTVDATDTFMFREDSDKSNWFVKNLLMNEILKANNVKIGVVPYINPKDSNYNLYNNKALGGPVDPDQKDSSKCGNVTSATCSDANYASCGIEADPTGCVGNGEPCQQSTCCKGLMCSDSKCQPCTPGCPNIAGQLMQWIANVNSQSKLQNGLSITHFVVDGEDAGSYDSVCGWSQIHQINEQLKAGLTKIGFAKGLNNGPVVDNSNVPLTNMVMPETYWYMNELAPCGGSPQQEIKLPPACTTGTSYRDFMNLPAEYVHFLLTSGRCGADKSTSAFLDNVKAYKDVMWPMFSFENLSMKTDDNKTLPCLASEFFPCTSKDDCSSAGAKPDVCGTFDGFAYWDWDKFYMFLTYFAYSVGVTQVGIYEAQFIPPHWFSNSSYPFPIADLDLSCPPASYQGLLPDGMSYTKDCSAVMQGSYCQFPEDGNSVFGTCHGVGGEKYVCDCNSSITSPDAIKNNYSICNKCPKPPPHKNA